MGSRKEANFTFKRSERLNRVLREELTALIARELRDPRIGAPVLTDVRTTDDLSSARVYYTLRASDEATRQAAQAGLEHAAGFLRGELGKRLHLRRIPQLLFARDTAIEVGSHIDELLRQIQAETPTNEEPAPDDARDDADGDA